MWRADRWVGEVEAKRIESAAFMAQLAEENDASCAPRLLLRTSDAAGRKLMAMLAARHVGGRAAGRGQEGSGAMRSQSGEAEADA